MIFTQCGAADVAPYWFKSHVGLKLECIDAGWSSPVARQAHNLKVVGSNPTPATKINPVTPMSCGVFLCLELGDWAIGLVLL
jgi:hypothetical protein